MRNYSALGLIFANMHDESFRDGTAVRSMGSLPFGGRYRLIDSPCPQWSTPASLRLASSPRVTISL